MYDSHQRDGEGHASASARMFDAARTSLLPRPWVVDDADQVSPGKGP